MKERWRNQLAKYNRMSKDIKFLARKEAEPDPAVSNLLEEGATSFSYRKLTQAPIDPSIIGHCDALSGTIIV